MTLYAGGYYRSNIIITYDLFISYPSVISYVDGNNVQRHVTVTYNDDISYKAKASDNFDNAYLYIDGIY